MLPAHVYIRGCLKKVSIYLLKNQTENQTE